VLAETDGPMLLHGIQGLHNTSILLPRHADLRPDPESLSKRWDLFRKAG
jgi:hypothetical protein